MTKPGKGVDPDPSPQDPPPDLPPPPATIDLASYRGELPLAYNVKRPFTPEPTVEQTLRERVAGKPVEQRRELPPPDQRSQNPQFK